MIPFVGLHPLFALAPPPYRIPPINYPQISYQWNENYKYLFFKDNYVINKL